MVLKILKTMGGQALDGSKNFENYGGQALDGSKNFENYGGSGVRWF